MSLAHPTGPESWPAHRLLSIAARLVSINRNLTHLGLTKGSLDVLESVAELEPVTVSDLATLLCVSKQSLGKVVRRLQGPGLVSRERSGTSSSDQRRTDRISNLPCTMIWNATSGTSGCSVPVCLTGWPCAGRRERITQSRNPESSFNVLTN
jgi:hypothetical protein